MRQHRVGDDHRFRHPAAQNLIVGFAWNRQITFQIRIPVALILIKVVVN